jgi:hypothetical protein
MFILRFISIILIMFGLMLFGADVVSTLENGGKLVIRSFAQILMLFHVDAKGWLEFNLPPQLAALSVAVISWPGSVVLGAPGLILGALLPANRDAKKRRTAVQPPIQR